MADQIVHEEWRAVAGFEGWYSVSSMGRVRRDRAGSSRTFAGRMLSLTSTSKRGYIRVALNNDKVRRYAKVHRLVAAAFLETDQHRTHVNHKNGIKTDNRVENLEWVTDKENHRHAVAIGLKAVGEGNGQSKLTETSVRAIRNDHRVRTTIAAEYGVAIRTIYLIKANQTWKHIR